MRLRLPTHHSTERRPSKKLLVVGAAVALVVAGLANGASATPSAAPAAGRAPAGIQWGDCTDPDLQDAGAVCGFLSVPLDYARPHGTQIQIAVSMVRHTTPDSQYQGVMLVNPGGPGGSGLGLATLGQFVPNGAGDSYDWIGFDPRGVGSSVPSLSCDPNYFSPNRPEYNPTTPALLHTWLSRSAGYAAACKADNAFAGSTHPAGGNLNAALLRHMTTIDAAKDMDSIRAALGQSQINYYGFSYGTYLGQVYSTLFPQRVRRMVLDSNVDPRNVWYQANLNQDLAFNRNIKIWFGWLAKYDSVYHLGTTEQAVEHLWYKEKDALRGHPAGGIVGPDEFTDIFLYAGYYQFFWLDLADAFAGWVNKGDADTLIADYESLDGPGDDNGFAVYLGVSCTDAQWPLKWSTWQRDNDRVNAVAPFATWLNAWFNAPCLYWPAPAGRPVKVDGRRVAPALLIDETLDAATPFEGSLEVRKLFPGSRLLAEPGGTTHAGSLFGNACVDDTIAAYLADGSLPARLPGNRPDALCDPFPQPVPDGAAARSLTPNTMAPDLAAPYEMGGKAPNGRPLVLTR